MILMKKASKIPSARADEPAAEATKLTLTASKGALTTRTSLCAGRKADGGYCPGGEGIENGGP